MGTVSHSLFWNIFPESMKHLVVAWFYSLNSAEEFSRNVSGEIEQSCSTYFLMAGVIPAWLPHFKRDLVQSRQTLSTSQSTAVFVTSEHTVNRYWHHHKKLIGIAVCLVIKQEPRMGQHDCQHPQPKHQHFLFQPAQFPVGLWVETVSRR